MEIVKERLEREFDLALIATAPSVEYRVISTDGTVTVVSNPADLPVVQKIDVIEEPVFKVTIITPKEYTGALMDLCQSRRGEMKRMEYLSPERVELNYEVPLAEVVVDFPSISSRSRSQGYASLDYEMAGYLRAQPGEGRHPAEWRSGRCLLNDRAPRAQPSSTGAGSARNSKS